MKDIQRLQILKALQGGSQLTPLDALRRFGCNRLAARINDLRNEGWVIDKELVEVGVLSGRTARVARYRMPATPMRLWGGEEHEAQAK